MLRAFDLVLRCVYVALIPILLPMLAMFMPITGMLVGVGIATVIALVGSDVWRAKVERLRYVGKILAGMGALGDFYRAHPPKPLVYYLLYPVLLPVLLFMRVPRREFLLYRKLNLVALVLVVGLGAWDYLRNWYPELAVTRFIGATIGMIALQLVVMFLLIMPIVTTLVLLREQRRIRVLSAVVTFMIGMAVFGAIAIRDKQTMPIMTWVRLEARTKVARRELVVCAKERPDEIARCLEGNREIRAMRDALVAGVRAAKAGGDVAAQTAAARAKLAEYYKADEASAFELASMKDAGVIYARHGKKPAIWLAFVQGKFTIDARRLPPPIAGRLGLRRP